MTNPHQPKPTLYTQPWLYQWLDSYGVKTFEEAKRLLSQTAARRALEETASEAVEYPILLDDSETVPTVLAGQGIDFTGRFGCSDPECIKGQIERLFGSVWHYFDRVAVVGLSPISFLSSPSWFDDEESEQYQFLLLQIEILLRIRAIGAEDLVLFVHKPGQMCRHHWDEAQQEVGIKDAKGLLRRIERQLAKELQIEFLTSRDESFAVTVSHPLLGAIWFHPLDHAEKEMATSQAKLRTLLARKVMDNYIFGLVADCLAARSTNLPLGSVLPLHSTLLRSLQGSPTEQEVALHLELPVLKGVDVETLLKVRQDEKDSFDAFRGSLRIAIQERIQSAGDKNAEAIAREIRADVIEPALRDIDRRLKAAKRTLGKKAVTSIGIGALATTCGLLAGQPLIVTTGVGTCSTIVGAAHKYIEERRDISLSDMYFVWQAQMHTK